MFRSAAFGIALVLFASACGDDSSGDVAEPPELTLALQDCFDPLFDGDSLEFLDFCDLATQAKSSGRLGCLTPAFEPEAASCEGFRYDLNRLPEYYRNPPEPIAEEPDADAEPPPPAREDAPGAIDEATGYRGDIAVLEWNQLGGCGQLGDFCGHWTVYGDGRVEASRSGGELLNTGIVEPGLVRDLLSEADTDTDLLVESLAPGPCRMAADGVDDELWIGPADVRLNTCEVSLSGDQPLIRAAVALGDAARIAAPIDWEAVGPG